MRIIMNKMIMMILKEHHLILNVVYEGTVKHVIVFSLTFIFCTLFFVIMIRKNRC